MTDTIQVTTDTDKPSPPIINNVNCTGTTQKNKYKVCVLCLSKCAIVVEWGVLLLDRATIAT